MQVFSTAPAPAWALAASHAGAVRECSKGHVKVLLHGGHSSTEVWKSPWGLGRTKPERTGRFGSPEEEGGLLQRKI